MMTQPPHRQNGPRSQSRSTVRQFEDHLASVLRQLGDEPTGWLVIAELERHPPLRYVQFLADEEGSLAVECVSNRFLRPEEQWRPDEERLLLEFGWSPPRPEQPNWHFTGRTSDAYDEVRELIHLTLVELFHADEDDLIGLKTAWSATSGA